MMKIDIQITGRWLLTGFMSMLFASLTFAQKKLSVKPPDTMVEKEFRNLPQNEEGYHNLFPLGVEFNYSYYHSHIKSPDSGLPAVYDLRTAGPGGTSLVSAVKGQQGCGACWAFACLGSIESALMVEGLGEYDLSENNMKNCHGFEPLPCGWGHHFMATAYLMRRSGPVPEADDPYEPTNGSCTGGLTPEFHFTQARYLPDDVTAIKEAIYNHGGIYTTMSFLLQYYNPIDYTYCDTISSNTGHAVVLVGWDDGKVVTGGSASPPGGRVGAFIAKNSRGLTFGEDGFFYVAYDDNLIKKYCAYWPDHQPYDTNLHVYQYDTIGGWPFVGYQDPVAYGVAKYVPVQEHLLASIGTYTVSFGSYLDIEIYDDFDGTVLSNLLTDTAGIYCETPGFYSVLLNEPVRVSQGDDFYVKVKYTAPGEDYPMAVEGIDPGYSNPALETGKCWASPGGMAWEACGLGTANLFDLCIKVYALPPTRLHLRAMLEGPFDSGAMSADLNNAGLIPLSQPYNTDPWNYEGPESVGALPGSDIVDWVLLELRETSGDAASATGDRMIARSAAFIRNQGRIASVSGSDTLSLDVPVMHNLYVVIRHRNHVPVMSANSLLRDAGGVYSYDFSAGSFQIYGGTLACKELDSGVFGLIAGDGFPNGQIDNGDKQDVWVQQAGSAGYLAGDFNLNGQVSNPDKNDLWAPNGGMGSQIPQ